MSERCSICNCVVHRDGGYAEGTVQGRSHATGHHYVAERFFGRSANRRGTQEERIFEQCPWGLERASTVCCYECHEVLLHNPVFAPADISGFSELVGLRNLNEDNKGQDRSKLAGRIKLLHEVIECGIKRILHDERQKMIRQ